MCQAGSVTVFGLFCGSLLRGGGVGLLILCAADMPWVWIADRSPDWAAQLSQHQFLCGVGNTSGSLNIQPNALCRQPVVHNTQSTEGSSFRAPVTGSVRVPVFCRLASRCASCKLRTRW